MDIVNLLVGGIALSYEEFEARNPYAAIPLQATPSLTIALLKASRTA
jgi:hypothetical protein